YDPASHPDVASGRLSPDEAFDDVTSALRRRDDDSSNENSEQMAVLFCDFMDYFRDLSAAIENDDYFQAVTLNAWVLPAQECPAAGYDDGNRNANNNNTASCRALVTHPDGVQEARKARSRLCIGAEDHDLMRKRLEEQGVQDIASVSLHEQ
ncbi:unnamed protein product, partial [Ectocarpus sp. 8 AP-2014]